MFLAQLNIAEAIEDMESPMLVDFKANLDRINTLAENSKGFIWRYIEDDQITSNESPLFDSRVIAVNMSVWTDRISLFEFVYASDHVEIFKRKAEWFKKPIKMHMVFWYIKEDHIPTIVEAHQKLTYLRENGESSEAFSFKSKY